MESDNYRDLNYKIFDLFSSEYFLEHDSFNSTFWRRFVIDKDIGIEFLYADGGRADIFKIIDERKFMLFKIKYGI